MDDAPRKPRAVERHLERRARDWSEVRPEWGLAGNEGDLVQGLSHQSVHDGERERHDPVRLQVLIEAATDRIDRVLAAREEIRRLVEGEWIVLHALELSGPRCLRRRPEGGWEPIEG